MNSCLLDRSFLRVSATASGGLVLTFYVDPVWRALAQALPSASQFFSPTAFAHVHPDGLVTITSKNPEIGDAPQLLESTVELKRQGFRTDGMGEKHLEKNGDRVRLSEKKVGNVLTAMESFLHGR
jgi:hypothetical protein